MGLLWNLLGKVGDTGSDLTSGAGIDELTGTAYNTFKGIMKIVMPIVLAAVLALGVFFCLKLGIAYAKTEKTEDREEAKKRLVGAIIGFGIGIVGAAVMWILFTSNALDSLFD